MSKQIVPRAIDLAGLCALDTCTVSNAIERLDARLRNEGFIVNSVKCQFPQFAPMAGYAATARIRTARPPMTGQRCYYDRLDWWTYVATVPEPRILVLEDVDHFPGAGAFVGEIHANIGIALNCIGCVTNGAVRDLPAVEALGFHLFAGSVSVSHSYAHIVDFGEPVELGGLKIQSGDLLHGDRHGVLSIPSEIAAGIPAEASRIIAEEQQLIAFCQSPRFSLPELDNRIRRMSMKCDQPWKPREK
ncbi:MAG: RraA family protein [Bryobacterales bacterium]|nr:RraA family protein [Bryobacterales bacterium]